MTQRSLAITVPLALVQVAHRLSSASCHSACLGNRSIDSSSFTLIRSGSRGSRSDMASSAVAIPEGGDELFAKYFSEITLDIIEEQTFLKRAMEEPGPRYVHLRRSSIGTVTIPPHIEENCQGEFNQVWTGHPKVDRTLFILDRRAENRLRDVKSIGNQRNIPMLRGVACSKKNYGARLGNEPLGDSFRAKYMNGVKKPPLTGPSILDS
ncbi:unnamed protein product [Effrenium voratum]|nr:unnamed protein product [Effrenium voratum]